MGFLDSNQYKMDGEWWEIGEDKICHDCGKHIKVGYRLIMAVAYNKTDDKEPQFRCKTCRDRKYETRGKECPLKLI